MRAGSPPIGAGRLLWVMLHRWAGLAIAFFLMVAGLTGALLAFYDELHRVTSPTWLKAEPPHADAPMLDPLTLRDRAEQASGGRIDYIRLDQYPGRTMFFYPRPAPGARRPAPRRSAMRRCASIPIPAPNGAAARRAI